MKLERTLINIFLIILYVVLSVAVIRPFLADIYFNTGKRFEAEYLWAATDRKYALALQLDPRNAEYHMNIGRAYAARSSIMQDKAKALLKAESEFEEAKRLNPHNSKNLAELAMIETRLFHLGRTVHNNKAIEAVTHFKASVEEDPNNFSFSYYVGHNILSMWDYIDKDGRSFAIECFKSCLGNEIWRSGAAYEEIWDESGDYELLKQATPDRLANYRKLYDFIKRKSLFTHRKDIEAIIVRYEQIENPAAAKKEIARESRRLQDVKRSAEKDGQLSEITKSIAPEKWQGMSEDGVHKIVNGCMYWGGTIYAVVNMLPGKAVISIEAKKYMAIGAVNAQNSKFYPYMVVKLDDEEIGEAFIGNDEWKGYDFQVNSEGGIKVLSIIFANDIYDPLKKEDRNLFVRNAAITYE